MGTIVLIVVGVVLGLITLGEEGLLVGGGLGLAFGMVASLKRRLLALELALEKQANPAAEKAPIAPIPQPEMAMAATAQADELSQILDAANATAEIAPTIKESVKVTPPQPIQRDAPPPTMAGNNPAENNPVEKLFALARDFFTTGNVVVKVGAVVLFFGVAFLLKYAADNNAFPIELRLLGVAIAGIVTLVLGWRLRTEKLEYGLILQGIGVGVLYLTAFAASKFYHVLPISFTLIMMLALVVLAGMLAVKQDAKSLAIFGTIGGFLAPILMSTGEGSHVMLFSYYALLNVGVLGLAWFKSWRLLNLIGFGFTFILSAMWGYKAYQADYFISTEPFLIIFFLFYLIISILFAHKQAPNLRGYVDGTLVFGLPLVAFALQSQLVASFEYGGAISAAAMGGLYLFLAKYLWKPEQDGVRLLAESFLALGIVFASLAIPLAFDGRWTAAVWSLEGAALVWIGLRQSQIISRGFGLLLAFGAGMVFLSDIQGAAPASMPILNSAFMGMVLVSLSALLIAYLYDKYEDKTFPFERQLSPVIVIWGLFWWFAAGLVEIDRFVSEPYQLNVGLLFAALTSLGQLALSHKLNWSRILLSTILLAPVIVVLLSASVLILDDNPFSHLGFLAWPIALGTHLMLLRRHEKVWDKEALNLWHAISIPVVITLVVSGVLWWLDEMTNLPTLWISCLVAMLCVGMIWSVMRWGKCIAWPVNQFKRSYYVWGLLPVMACLLAWQFVWFSKTGAPVLFNYLPVLNPLDITQAVVFAIFAYWLWFINQSKETQLFSMSPRVLYGVIAAMGFVWVNVVMARSVHFFGNVDYTISALMASSTFQMVASIVWTLIAMLFMMIASKRASRLFWIAGAGLLAVVVAKLFFVDLAGSGSVSRIVSFLVVGVLMLVVGYVSPLPPKAKPADTLSSR